MTNGSTLEKYMIFFWGKWPNKNVSQVIQINRIFFESSIVQPSVQRSIHSVLLQNRPVVFQDVIAESSNVLLDARSSQVTRDTRLSQLIQGNRLGVRNMPDTKPEKPQNCHSQCSQHCLFAALSTVGPRAFMETGFLINWDQWHHLESRLGVLKGDWVNWRCNGLNLTQPWSE